MSAAADVQAGELEKSTAVVRAAGQAGRCMPSLIAVLGGAMATAKVSAGAHCARVGGGSVVGGIGGSAPPRAGCVQYRRALHISRPTCGDGLSGRGGICASGGGHSRCRACLAHHPCPRRAAGRRGTDGVGAGGEVGGGRGGHARRRTVGVQHRRASRCARRTGRGRLLRCANRGDERKDRREGG